MNRHSLRHTHQQRLKISPKILQLLGNFQLSYAELQSLISEESNKNVMLDIRPPQHNTVELPATLQAPEKTLTAVLLDQLTQQHLEPTNHAIAEYLIDAITPDGYIHHYPDVSAEIQTQLAVSARKIRSVLSIIHTFEPDGVGARSLTECLMIQLNQKDLDNTLLQACLSTIIQHHIQDFYDTKTLASLAETLNITLEQATAIQGYLSHQFHPKPGNQYASTDTNPTLYPSFSVSVSDKKTVQIENLEQRNGVTAAISPEYMGILEDPKTPAETRQFLRGQYEKAKAVIDTIQARWERLDQLVTLIAHHQQDYLNHGPIYIKPLAQRDLAEHVSVSLSTVSRLVNAKSIQTPHGIILLKSLCQRQYFGKTKQQFQAIVHDYCDKYPDLSDNALRHRLNEELSISIARRTVTKYRNSLKIPNHWNRGNL
ncbi:hypothetical protein CL648_00570 [bacterium]|nr:hypothetical protein [bacterium]|tara:strand:+ start:8580 stop:9863 length:1284 start_codon:yes stop_codon:yes gene_type:complete